LAGFFEKFLPEQKHKFGRLLTPVKATTKNGKINRWTYSISEDFEPKAGESIKWYKGLGSWGKEQLEAVIAKDGLENMIEYFDYDDPQILKDFLSSEESDKRKEYIRNNDFSIAKI
jgi:ribosomal protein S18